MALGLQNSRLRCIRVAQTGSWISVPLVIQRSKAETATAYERAEGRSLAGTFGTARERRDLDLGPQFRERVGDSALPLVNVDNDLHV